MMIDINKAFEFAKYFASSDWEFFDSKEIGDVYFNSKTKKILTIDKIFEEWDSKYVNVAFKQKLKDDIIPRLEELVIKEKEYLDSLISNDSCLGSVELSKQYHSHYTQRLKEYKEYIKS